MDVSNEPKSRSRRRRAAWGVLSGAVVIVALQLGFGAYAERNPKRKDPAYGDKLTKLKVRANGEPLVVQIGSSRTLLGFHAGQVEAECPGVRAFNFGTPASGPFANSIYLRRMLNEGIVPDLLLVELLPPAFAEYPDGPGEQAALTGERLSERELDFVIRYGFPKDKSTAAWRESVHNPLHTLRFQLLGWVAPSWLPWRLRFDWSRKTDPHGWVSPLQTFVTSDQRTERSAMAAGEYRENLAAMHPEASRPLDALAEMLDFSRERGIPTRLILMPESPWFQSLYPTGVYGRFRDTIQRIARERGSGVIDSTDWLAEEEFYDGHHMFRAGAEKFTRRLTDEVIRPHLEGGPR